MNKKNLPKAIRPESPQQPAQEAPPVKPAAADGGSKTGAHAPRKAAPAKAKQAAAPETAEAKDRRARAVKVVKRLSLWSGAAGLIPMPLRRPGGRRRRADRDAAPHFKNLRRAVFREPRQSAHRRHCRLDDPGQQRDRRGEPDQGHARHWHGGQRADDADAVDRRHLRDRHGLHPALSRPAERCSISIRRIIANSSRPRPARAAPAPRKAV